MKTTAAALALLTHQAYGTEYSIIRTLETEAEYPLVTLSDITWKMYVQSAYDEDTGKEWLQIQHSLVADIKSTDSVEFELSFTSKGDPWTDRVN